MNWVRGSVFAVLIFAGVLTVPEHYVPSFIITLLLPAHFARGR